jgi:Peptidase MA superfamily
MRQIKLIIFLTLGLLALVIFLSATRPVSALVQGDVTKDQPVLSFPNTITFQVEINSPDKITSIVLEYGDQEETCGQIIAKAYPRFTSATKVTTEWVWDMRQSGSLPPGAQIWWRWRYTEATGKETVTDRKTILWLDSVHGWQTLSKGDIRLHWYKSYQSFAQDLLDTAYNGLARIEKDAGLSTDQPIDVYIYADSNDMQDAILYAPSWTGGEAFPEHNIVIIGISPVDLSWGRRAEVHELTHVLVGHLTFTCLGSVPTWLNEGLAVYSEGELDPASQTQLTDAIKNDTLLTVRSLSGAFSEVANKANLSYSESYSIVKFLIEKYGRDKMTALLIALRDGNTVDRALTNVYGFDIEGLETVWRASIGARVRPAVPNATAQPTPTYVPTIVPVSGAPLAITPTPFNFPTPVSTNQPPSGPPLSLTFTLLFTCCGLGLILGVLILGFVLAMQKRKGGSDEKPS